MYFSRLFGGVVFLGASRGGFSSCAAPGLRGAARFGRKLSPPGAAEQDGTKKRPRGRGPVGGIVYFLAADSRIKTGSSRI